MSDTMTTVKKKFSIQKGHKYLITEKPNAATPIELKKIGRAKQGGGFFESADIPFDEQSQKYDTGLDRTSREFIGKSDEEITKILKDRKELVDYHNQLVQNHPEKSEIKVVVANKMIVRHNLIVNTSNIVDYYRLFLAMRGGTITPSIDKGNLARANTSMYQISDDQEEKNYIEELAEKRMKAEQWLYARLGKSTDKKLALEVLRYEKILNLNETKKSDALVLDLFKKNMEDYNKLEDFLYTIENIEDDVIYMTNDVGRLILNGVIRKEKANLVYDGIVLGVNVKEVVSNLKSGKGEFNEIALKLFNTKEDKEKKEKK